MATKQPVTTHRAADRKSVDARLAWSTLSPWQNQINQEWWMEQETINVNHIRSTSYLSFRSLDDVRDSEEGLGTCGWILVALSYFLCVITLPFSLCATVKVVQEYERAVIMRLGRILPGRRRARSLPSPLGIDASRRCQRSGSVLRSTLCRFHYESGPSDG